MEYVEEEEPQTAEEYLESRKASMRQKSYWAIGIGSLIVVGHLVLFAIAIYGEEGEQIVSWQDLLRSIYFVLGLFALVAGFVGLREARKLTFEDLVPTPEAIAFSQQIEFIKPYYSFLLVGALVVVYLVQTLVDASLPVPFDELPSSLARAGLIKPLVFSDGQWWRLMTGATLHASLLHIFFNGYALFGFGRLIEYLANRAHLTIVLLLSMVSGNLLSLVLMPDTTSVGASGGIMGLIGYLAIYGLRRRRQLMPGFLKAMLTNIGFIAAFGLIAYQIIDNFAHFGGLLFGAVYGYLQIPRDLRVDARAASPMTRIAGVAAVVIFLAACLFSILVVNDSLRP